jgi:TRAP-type mannitol/chloroaromatic compound transport system permease small subunit
MRILIAFANWIDALLRIIAEIFSWTFIALILVICGDVVTRKFGFQLPEFGSTRLQELEWHLHAILFCTWIGFAYIRDAHVRVDVFTSRLDARSRAWIELSGCALLALPYVFVALPYAHNFFMVSYLQNEMSDAPNGLAFRWVIKGFLYFAFLSVLLAVVSVAIRQIAVLFGRHASGAASSAVQVP